MSRFLRGHGQVLVFTFPVLAFICICVCFSRASESLREPFMGPK